MHSFQAVTDVELSLSIGEYVVVRKVLLIFYFSMLESCFLLTDEYKSIYACI